MESKIFFVAHMCQGRLTPYIGDSHPTLSDRDPGYINPYYWVHDHPLSYRNNGSLDESDSRKFRSATYLAPDSGGGV